MFVLIWATLLLSVRGNNTGTDGKKLVIAGKTTVNAGDTLHLNCSVKGFQPSETMWTTGCSKNRRNETKITLQNDTGMAILVISNVTAEDTGQYICTAKYPSPTLTMQIGVTVTLCPKISNSSGCMNQSKVLTPVCISEGLPLPTIKWPLLGNQTEYSVITTVSNTTVDSTITLTVKDFNIIVEWVKSIDGREANENIVITIHDVRQEDLLTKFLITVKQPQVIIAFLIGILLATICCLPRKCHRKKQRISGNLAENLEMVTNQAVPQIDDGQAVEDDDGTHDQEAAEGRAEASGKSAPNGDMEPKEVEYSNIDFSMMKRKSLTWAKETQEPTETEYAEIKREVTQERQDNGDEEVEVLEGDEEEEAMIGEDRETHQCMQAEEGGEAVGLYSNVNEITA